MSSAKSRGGIRKWLAVTAAALLVLLGLWGAKSWFAAPVDLEAGANPAPPGNLPVEETAVTALGRLQPGEGVITVAGPSQPTVVLAELLVAEGDRVGAGQPIAELDTAEVRAAAVAGLESELDRAQSELRRHEKLYAESHVSASRRDEWRTKVRVVRADLRRAKAELSLATVRSPIDGQVLKVHTRAGERVGPEGIVELGETAKMYAVAEVYETDIGRVKRGQRAVITSPAFAGEIHGTVERIGMEIGKKDVLGTDPAADTDARVVEVEIRLDEAERVARLTNLRVDVAISP